MEINVNVYPSGSATVAQHMAHPLVFGKVIGSNLGQTPRQYLETLKMVPTVAMSDVRQK